MTSLPRNSSQEQRRQIQIYSNKPVACTRCDETNPTKFYYDPNGYRNSACRKCEKERKALSQKSTNYRKIQKKWRRENPTYGHTYNFRHKYGLSGLDYQNMLARQNGVCLICGQPPAETQSLSVDHCHATGKVRGLLCIHCNTGIGMFKDSQELLRKAAEYLEK